MIRDKRRQGQRYPNRVKRLVILMTKAIWLVFLVFDSSASPSSPSSLNGGDLRADSALSSIFISRVKVEVVVGCDFGLWSVSYELN